MAELPGRLAITATGELVLTDPTGGNVEVVDSAAFVAQPTWAPTAEALAWTRAEGDEGRSADEQGGECEDADEGRAWFGAHDGDGSPRLRKRRTVSFSE